MSVNFSVYSLCVLFSTFQEAIFVHVYCVCVQLCPISNWTWALCHASQSYWFLTAHTCEHAQTYYCSYLPCPKVIFPGINAAIETGWAETEKHSRCLLVHHDNTHISNIHKCTYILIPHLLISSLPRPYLNKGKNKQQRKKCKFPTHFLTLCLSLSYHHI